jgi:hypothetical protein
MVSSVCASSEKGPLGILNTRIGLGLSPPAEDATSVAESDTTSLGSSLFSDAAYSTLATSEDVVFDPPTRARICVSIDPALGCNWRRYELRGDTGRPIMANKRMISKRTTSPSVRQSSGMRNSIVRRGLRESLGAIRGVEGGGCDGLISRLKNSVSESYSCLFASAACSASESCSGLIPTVVCGVTYAIPHGALPSGEDLLGDKAYTGLTMHEPPDRLIDMCN